MSSAGTEGCIITFYSYKGGTGRSMALANVAWILAAAGRRVLAVDWDLEAPGLHRYLHPFLLDPESVATDGVIDFVTEYVAAAMSPARDPDPGWYESLADLASYAVSLDTGGLFPKEGTLDFVSAGRQGPAYASRINAFDWRNFFERLGGGRFLMETAKRLRSEYDYVLIDSRTGVSDTSGICTVTLPDRLVVCFTMNSQSIRGAAAVVESIQQQREALDLGTLTVFPIPMRVELAEHERLERARSQSRMRFDGLLSHVSMAERERYWGDVEILYLPIYAYEEVLAVFVERPEQPVSVLAALERVTARVTDGDVTAVKAPREVDRERVLARYMGGPGSLLHESTEAFRDRVHAASKLIERIRPATRLGTEEGRDRLQKLERELGDLSVPSPEFTIHLLLAYRDMSAWEDMVRVVDTMPTATRDLVTVREQRALALNRRNGPGDRAEAIQALQAILEQYGPSPETSGILGRCWKDASDEATDPDARAVALDAAIDAYGAGFEADPRDYYPGVNLVTLLLHRGTQEDLYRLNELVPVVRFAVTRRGGLSSHDYWGHATVLELAVIDGDEHTARRAKARISLEPPPRWMLETTARNLRILARARSRAGNEAAWVGELADALAPAQSS